MQARWPHAAWLLDRLSAELPVLEVAGGTGIIQECVPIRGAAGMSGSTDSEEGEGEYREEDDEIGEYISWMRVNGGLGKRRKAKGAWSMGGGERNAADGAWLAQAAAAG